jgi:hypothetical protein
MVFTVHCESVGWLTAICASPTTAVLPLRNVSSFHRYSRQALSIKARGMKGLRRVIIDMAAARPLSPADRDAFLRHVATVLATQPTLGDGIVARVCREVQRRFGTRRSPIPTSMTDRRAKSCAGPGPTIAHLLPTQRCLHPRDRQRRAHHRAAASTPTTTVTAITITPSTRLRLHFRYHVPNDPQRQREDDNASPVPATECILTHWKLLPFS